MLTTMTIDLTLHMRLQQNAYLAKQLITFYKECHYFKM